MTTRTAKEIATWLRGNMWSTETLQAFLDSAPAMDDTDKIKAENARLREQLDKYRSGMDANIQNRKERGLLTEEEEHLVEENERLREKLNASQSAYEKLSRLFNGLERSQNEACKQLKTAREAADPFIRIAYLMDPLNLLDSKPLQSTLPLGWPVLGDCRKLRDAFAKIKKRIET